MDIRRLCASCFNSKEPNQICPHCGWVEGTPPASPFYLPHQVILHGKYLIGKVLGQGGFGITYLAWDLDLGVKLAIKEFLPREFAGRSVGQTMVTPYSGSSQAYFNQGLEKFLDEAKTLARLEGHHNIVSVRDFFRENGTAYFVMNYLEGMTLKDYLNRRGSTLDFPSAFQIMSPVMDGLNQVHGLGILHRDISPDNIFITETGMVKILDFGAARQALGEHSKSLSVILKPGFAPEEQYRSKGRQGPWTDVYAVASTLYLMICGKTPPDSLDRMSGEPLPSPSQLGAAISLRSEAALLKGLAVKGEQRYQTMPEFQQALYAGISDPFVSLTPAYSYAPPQISKVQVQQVSIPVHPVSVGPAPQPSSQAYYSPHYAPADQPQVQPQAVRTGALAENRTLLISLAGIVCLVLLALGVYSLQSNDQITGQKTPQTIAQQQPSSSTTQTSAVTSGPNTPEKVIKDFYDSISRKDYSNLSNLLSGEALATFSQDNLSKADITITSYRITENKYINSTQARITVECQVSDATSQRSAWFRDVWLLENRSGRWTVVTLMGETQM